MERVLIDTLIVPEESTAEFLERVGKVQTFLKALPGFIGGLFLEKKTGRAATIS